MAKMILKEQLELVDVQFENQKATMVYLDEAHGEIREVSFNKQGYDKTSKKYVDDPIQAIKTEERCEEHFGLSFDRLAELIGEKRDIYCYDNFNSVYEVQQIEKFEDDMEGQIFETEIVKAVDDGKKISLQFEYEGNLYESKMQYADYLEPRNEWFVNPQKKEKQYKKFKEKFNMSVDEIDQMVGKVVMVEVKKAMGKYIYSEIKPFKKVKKNDNN